MSQYTIFITPRAWRELKTLPGNMRQRLRREIESLASAPRPSTSKALEVPAPEEEKEEAQPFELRRLRIDRWRVVYTVTDEDYMVDILTVQKRPPYDYGDLSELTQEME